MQIDMSKNSFHLPGRTKGLLRTHRTQSADLQKAMEPQQMIVKDADRVMGLKYLDQDPEVYLEWKNDITACREKRAEQARLKAKLEQLLSQNVDQWEKDRQAI